MVVWTIGHSTHPIQEFIGLLNEHGIKRVIDVRKIPRSRHNPQFARENLPGSLAEAGIRYHHMPGLGGLRRARPDSRNAGWRNASFRGYADYLQTQEFEQNLGELIELARAEPAAMMCAEAVPWRCHRWLIADALTVRGITVEHIQGNSRAVPHQLTNFAQVDGMRIFYPRQPNEPQLRLAGLDSEEEPV